MLTREPVVQIHASRFCNYQCLHCYSTSGPRAQEALSVNAILKTTRQLAKAGYRRASLSGGEPVLYTDFEALAEGLTRQGFSVSVITNGTQSARLIRVMQAGYVDHASVSFDGPCALHDKIRQKPGAYKQAKAALDDLVKAGQSAGAVLSVTRDSLVHIPSVVANVVALGARHIQLHPLASIGRADASMSILGPELAPEALLRLIFLAAVLEALHSDITVQCDALTGQTLKTLENIQLGKLITPLIIRDDGLMLPYSYDVSRSFSLGHVGGPTPQTQVSNRLNEALAEAFNVATRKPATTFYREVVAASHIEGRTFDR